MRAFTTSIRARLVLLALVATVPLLLFSAALLQRAYRVSAGLVEDGVRGDARQLAVALDGQIGRAEAIARAVAELPLDRTDPRRFEQAAARALHAAGVDWAIVLAAPDRPVVRPPTTHK